MTRSPGRLVAGLMIMLCAIIGPTTSPAAAHAAGRTGACTGADANAVTIVIDYQGLGGGTATYCASNLASGSTGLDALAAVGVPVTGTAKDGTGFVCRVNGRPGAGETITLPNGEAYQEQCVNSPPGTAYWSYWWAKAGGSWGYTSQGAATRQVVFGSYEGWSFALGGGIGNAPAPRVAPAVWEVPPVEQPVTQPTQPAATQAPATSAPPATGNPDDTVTESPAATPGDPSTVPAASPSATPVPSPTSTKPVEFWSPAGQANGPNWGLIVAVVGLVVLAAAAIVVARIRRRKS